MFHKKTTANFITAIFAILIIVQVFGFLTTNIITDTNNEVSAAFEKGKNPLDNLQIKIPGLKTDVGDGQIIGSYIEGIYRYAIGSVGILATVVMMYAGMLWITAAGNTEQIGKAKSYITASLTGTVLALTSWMILYQVNPDLTSFKEIEPVPVDEFIPTLRTAQESGSLCSWQAAGTSKNCYSLAGYEDGEGKCSGKADTTYNTCCCRTASILYDDTEAGCCTYMWYSKLQCLDLTELGCYLSAESRSKLNEYDWSKTCPEGCTAEEKQAAARGCCLSDYDDPEYEKCEDNQQKEACDLITSKHVWVEDKNCNNDPNFWGDQNYKCE